MPFPPENDNHKKQVKYKCTEGTKKIQIKNMFNKNYPLFWEIKPLNLWPWKEYHEISALGFVLLK